MKKIGLIPNLIKDKDLSITKKVYDYLLEKNLTPLVQEIVSSKLNLENYPYGYNDVINESDFIIVLGGDGTLLGAARKAAKRGTPLLGINLGTLGFLTDVDIKDFKGVIDKVIEGNYRLEERLMLDGVILNNKTKNETHIALNDVCVLKGVFSKMLELSIYVNNAYLDTYRADGIIVSTPTGSTAYNLSAGGPILKPDIETVAITPICPHSLHARSIIVSAEDEITIKVNHTKNEDCILSIDGQPGILLKDDEFVQVRRSKYTTMIVKTMDMGFYDILRNKIIM